jgi:hypothetical protein
MSVIELTLQDEISEEIIRDLLKTQNKVQEINRYQLQCNFDLF